MGSERAFWLAWSQVDGIGPILLRRLHELFGTLEVAWNARAADLLEINGIGLQLADAIANARAKINPASLLAQHETANPHFWTPADADYPRLLLETPDPPAMLYFRGVVDPNENQGIQPLIGIVGTRDPSDYGKKWTQQLTTTLVQNGFTVVSGLAEGVDTWAHRSCLEAQGRTIAVLGTGVDVIYPWKNQQLYSHLIQSGLAVSEFPCGTKPDRANFPRRNRIIAGLCRAIIVMEAPERSGALITAHMANEYGRDVYILPGSLDNSKSLGCLALLNQGAQVILGETHLLDLLGSLPQIDVPTPTAPPMPTISLSLMQQQIFAALNELSQLGVATSLDKIVQHTAQPAGLVSAELLQLELLGLVTQLPGMLYRRA